MAQCLERGGDPTCGGRMGEVGELEEEIEREFVRYVRSGD
jgi:hypothetical protein